MYYLGTVSGASGSYSNQATGASGLGIFTIPPGTKAVYLLPSASGMLVELGVATGPTGSTFQTTALRGAQLAGPNVLAGPFRVVSGLGQHPVVAIYNSAAGFVSCRVYAAPTS